MQNTHAASVSLILKPALEITNLLTKITLVKMCIDSSDSAEIFTFSSRKNESIHQTAYSETD